MTTIRKEIFIEAPPERVWRHLEVPALLAGWLMRTDFRAEPGAVFHFWQAPSGNWDGTIHSAVVECDPPRRLSFTWNANSIGVDTLVTIDLEARGEGSLVRLLHTNWDGATGDLDRHSESHSAGWEDHLRVLASQVAAESAGTTPPPVDWTRFTLYMVIDVPAKRIFDAWSTSGGMESLFVEMMAIHSLDGRLLPTDEAAVPGCRYAWRWDSGALASGEFLEVEAGRAVGFTFGEARVRVALHPQEQGTLVMLTQYDMPDDEVRRMHLHTNCRAAWVYFLTVLKTLLEQGVDGRDRTRATGSSLSTYFDPGAAGLELSA